MRTSVAALAIAAARSANSMRYAMFAADFVKYLFGGLDIAARTDSEEGIRQANSRGSKPREPVKARGGVPPKLQPKTPRQGRSCFCRTEYDYRLDMASRLWRARTRVGAERIGYKGSADAARRCLIGRRHFWSFTATPFR